MRKIHLQVLAESDLLEVWQYSFEQWDADEADKYLDEINEGIGRLAENPELGAKRDYVRSGYRALLINRHAVYYTVKASTIQSFASSTGKWTPSGICDSRRSNEQGISGFGTANKLVQRAAWHAMAGDHRRAAGR